MTTNGTTDKPKKQRSANMQAGALANDLVKARTRIARHNSGLKEAIADLEKLEKDSDPTVLAMAKALLSATVAPPAVKPEPVVVGKGGERG